MMCQAPKHWSDYNGPQCNSPAKWRVTNVLAQWHVCGSHLPRVCSMLTEHTAGVYEVKVENIPEGG